MPTRCLRSASLLGALFVAAVSVVAGTAWACVPFPQALATIQPQSSGQPGMEVTVQGLGYDKGPVEIRWNALDGPRLATATGPDFTVPATIPESPDGLYVVVVLSRAQDGSIGSAGSAPFQVISTAGIPGSVTAPPSEERSSSSSRSSVPALLTGAALVAVGGLGGAFAVSRRRKDDQGGPGVPRR